MDGAVGRSGGALPPAGIDPLDRGSSLAVTMRAKTLTAMGIALLVLLVTEQVLLRRLLLDGFAQSQSEYAAAALASVRRHLSSKVQTFHERMTSWTERGDIRDYLTPTPDGHRLTDPFVLTSLNIDALITLDSSGGVLVAIARDRPDGTQREVPSGLLGRATPGDRFTDFAASPKGISGLFALPEGLFILCSLPLATGTDPHERGSLVVARQITEDRLDQIEELSGIRFAVFGPATIPDRLARVAAALDRNKPPMVRPLDEHEVAVYGMLGDIDGQRTLLVEAQVPATIAAHGNRTAAFVTLSLLAIGLAFGATVLLLMERLVLSRVHRLRTGLRAIGEGDRSARLDESGEDELAELGGAMNRTLDALAGARAEAEGANRAKSEFLANITHEIRTPMNAIVGYAELLEDGECGSQERSEAATTIKRNAETLLLIINDLLDLSKIEAGGLTLKPTPCFPMQIVEDAVSLLSIKARDKGIELSAAHDGSPQPCVRTDPIRLRQILINLVGNAIKFTDAGSVRVEVSARAAGDTCTFVASVNDTGVGISREHIERLFQPFSQVDSSLSRAHGGTGLGLAISRRLARQLGGDIEVTSEPGVGSTFTLSLRAPLANADRTDGPLRRAPEPPVRLRGRVLVAEDGLDNQRLVLFHLRKAGADVETVTNGREAVDAALIGGAAHRPFDLVLMDVQMPVLDGYQAARELRDRGYTAPILAFTAHSDEDSRRACLSSGCDDFLAKPVDARRLIRAAELWIERGRVRAQHGPAADPGRQAA